MHKTAYETKTRSIVSVFAALCLALTMSLGMTTTALAEDGPSVTDPAVTIYTYSADTDENTADYNQHVVVEVDYGAAVAVNELGFNGSMSGDEAAFTITIAGYDITSESYHRPVTATADGTKLVLDIGNCTSPNEVSGEDENSFTAQYGGVINISGTPGGVTAGGQSVGALSYYSVIPTGVHISMTNEGTSTVTAAVDHVANVRGMVHVVVYEEQTIDGDVKFVPVNSGGTTAGNLGVGAATTHAHNFASMTVEALASGAASALAGVMPEGYTVTYTSGDSFTVSGPEGSKLHVYVFDDAMLQDLGWTFSGIVSTEGIGEYEEFLPDSGE